MNKQEEVRGRLKNKLIHGPAEKGLKLIPDGLIDLTVTSPPY